MKYLLLTTLLSTAAFCAQAKPKYYYKCWVTLTDGTDLISYQELKTKGKHHNAKKELIRFGKVGSYKGLVAVQEVHECVEASKAFTSYAAKELEKHTLR